MSTRIESAPVEVQEGPSRSRRRIVHIITKLDVGGAQETAVRSCVGLLRRGYEVTLVTGWHGGEAGPMARTARESGVTVVEVPKLVRPIRPWLDLLALLQLVRLLRALRPDVARPASWVASPPGWPVYLSSATPSTGGAFATNNLGR